MKKNIKVVLCGNPNCGKTTIFNKLTKSLYKVANYPGVTVDIKEGISEIDGNKIEVIDLPGIYSLSAHSKEEIIARDYILKEKPDLIINIIDSSNLKRSLYLTTELMELEVPIILVCNKKDLASYHGIEIDFEKLSSLLEVKIVETIASKSIGIEDILKIALDVVKNKNDSKGIFIHFSKEIDSCLSEIQNHLENEPRARLRSIKLLEDDKEYKIDDEILNKVVSEQKNKIKDKKSIEEIISLDRHLFLQKLVLSVLKKQYEHKETLSDKLDHFFTHKYFGLPIFLAIIFLIFQFTFFIGSYPTIFLEKFFDKISYFILNIWTAPSLLRSLVVDGIINGVGSVLVFVPNILLLFIAITILEESGYMARAALVMDRIMHKIGLHGRSFLPMIIGFGCTVPAIESTRILENKRDRLTTILVLPLISCSAKLAVFTLLIPAFFSAKNSALILFGLYLIGIVLAIVVIKLFRKTLLKGENIPFIMEMPSYQIPSFKNMFISTWEKAGVYVKKAGSFIMLFSIVFWFLSIYPKDEKAEKTFLTSFKNLQEKTQRDLEKIAPKEVLEDFFIKSEKQKNIKNYKLDLVKNKSNILEKKIKEIENSFNHSAAFLKEEKAKDQLEYSLVGSVGKALIPVFSPLGFDWRINTALLGAISAKEVFISQLSIIFATGDDYSNIGVLQNKIKSSYSKLQGFCILLFLLISAPCIATIAMTRKETASFKWAFFQIGYLTILAYVITLFIYQTFSHFI